MSENAHPASMTKVYLAVFGSLAFLTALTVGVSYLHLARPEAIAVALVVAGIKVTLIATFFMHLKFEGKLIHYMFYTAVLLVVWLLSTVLPDIAFRQ